MRGKSVRPKSFSPKLGNFFTLCVLANQTPGGGKLRNTGSSGHFGLGRPLALKEIAGGKQKNGSSHMETEKRKTNPLQLGPNTQSGLGLAVTRTPTMHQAPTVRGRARAAAERCSAPRTLLGMLAPGTGPEDRRAGGPGLGGQIGDEGGYWLRRHSLRPLEGMSALRARVQRRGQIFRRKIGTCPVWQVVCSTSQF